MSAYRTIKNEANRVLAAGQSFIRLPNDPDMDEYIRVFSGPNDVTEIALSSPDTFSIMAMDLKTATHRVRDIVVPLYNNHHILDILNSDQPNLGRLIQESTLTVQFLDPGRLALYLQGVDASGKHARPVAANKRRRVGTTFGDNDDDMDDDDYPIPNAEEAVALYHQVHGGRTVPDLPVLDEFDDDPLPEPVPVQHVMQTDQAGYDNMRMELVEDLRGQGYNDLDANEQADMMMAQVAVANADRDKRRRNKHGVSSSGDRFGTWAKVAEERRNVAASVAAEIVAAPKRKQQSTMDRFLWPKPHHYKKPVGQMAEAEITRIAPRKKIVATLPDGWNVTAPVITQRRFEESGLSPYHYADGLWDQYYRDNLEGRPAWRKDGKSYHRTLFPRWWAKPNKYYPHTIRYRFMRDILQQIEKF